MVAFQARLESSKIAIIGAGHIGTAVVDALYRSDHRHIVATRTKGSEEKLRQLEQQYKGVYVTTDNAEAVDNADIIVLAVKPYCIEEAAQQIKQHSVGKLVISVAAAKKLGMIEGILETSRVARVMTGVFVADEVAAYALGTRGGAEEKEYDRNAIKYIFGADARELAEELLAHRTWVACDTGLLSYEVELKVQKLKQLGMNEEAARLFYAATLEAIGTRLRAGMSGDAIYNLVAGQKSFTAKMRQFLEDNGCMYIMEQAIEQTVSACNK